MFHARKPRSVAFWSFEKVSREIKQGSGVPFCPRMETLNGKPVNPETQRAKRKNWPQYKMPSS